MRWLIRVRSIWRGLTSRSVVETEIEEELQHHIEQRARDLMAAGLAPGEAARCARLELGSIRVPGLDSVPRPQGPGPYFTPVSPDYFRTIGARIVRGRAFRPTMCRGARRSRS